MNMNNQRPLLLKFNNFLRLLRLRALFKACARYCDGRVLDIGGFDFFKTIKDRPEIAFTNWTSLELEKKLFKSGDSRYKAVFGNGENMEFPDGSFDTVLNIQVLEHTFNPQKMVFEMARVLRSGGHGILLIPQSSLLHDPPTHYYNFTKFWITKAMEAANLEIVELKPLGGFWTTEASHLVLFFFKALKLPYYSTKEDKRSFIFYLLLPFMIFYAIVSVPFCMLFSLGDLIEDPNNWLVVVRKS